MIKKFLAARAGGAMPANTTALVKLDNSTTLEAATNYINALGLKSRCLYSGDKDVKSGNNKLLNSIQNDSTFGGEALDILFVTCFLEAGVSIKENLCVINIDTVEPSKIIQLSNRGRLDLAKGINQNISVWVCVPTPEKPQNLPHDFCVLNEFDTRVLQAKNKAALANLHHQNLNEIEQKKHKESIAGDKDFNIYFDANTNAFEANTIQIISTLESESLKGQTAELLFSRINTLDNRTTLVGIEKISTQKLDKSHALIIHLDSQKEQNKELENAFDLLFLGEENPANLLVWFGAKSKSKSLKDSISTALNFSIDTAKKDALAYFSSLAPEIQDVFSTLKDSKLSKRLDNIIFYINQSFSVKDAVKEALTNADTKIAADKLTAIQISTDARLTQNKTIKGRANINALQLANAAFDAAIKNAFARKRYNLALRPNEKPITKNYISNVINTVAKSHSVGKLIQFKECLDILNRLYCVESKRIRTDGKQETIYTLGDLKICD